MLNSIDELKATKSWKYLNHIDESSSLLAIKFIEHITPILATIKTHFPYYTRHDAQHGYQVLKRIEDILLDSCFEINQSGRFDSSEIFLLICAAYAHDLGMTVFPGEKEGLLKQLEIIEQEGWEQSVFLQSYLRNEHSTRGGEYINSKAHEIGIPQNLVYPLHQLMSSHNWSIQQIETEFSRRTAANHKEIYLQQLACILCIADSIEFSDSRVIDGVLDQLIAKSDIESITSYRENMKHFCIQNSVAVADDGKILFSGTFDDPNVLNLAHKTVDLIDEWVRNYCDIDYSSKIKRLRIRSDSVSRNFNSLNFDFIRLGIRIKKENVIKLISSNSLWASTTLAAIKELLQNSVEACRYRQFNSSKSANYIPLIKVKIDFIDNNLVVEDNGCGMSRNVVLNNFLTVGNSRSFEPTYKSGNYLPLSKFGIGFWSVFTIAKECEVETSQYEQVKPDNITVTDGLRFTINIGEFNDYTVFGKIKRIPGTCIKLQIKDDVNLKEIALNIPYLMTCSEIPVQISINEKTTVIDTQLKLPSFQEMFGPKTQSAKKGNIDSFRYTASDDDFDFIYDIYYQKTPKISFLLWDGSTFNVQHVGAKGKCQFSICGFKINITEYNELYYSSSVGCYILNAKKPDGFNYNLSRNALIENEKSDLIKRKILEFTYAAYRSFLKSHNIYDSEHIYRLNIETRRNRGGGYPFWSGSQFRQAFRNNSDLICFRLTELGASDDYQQANPIHVNLKELYNNNYKICTNIGSFHLNVPPGTNVIQLRNILMYSLLTQHFKGQEKKAFYHELNPELMMLFDNCHSVLVEVLTLPSVSSNQAIKIPIISFKTSELDWNETKTEMMKISQGSWQGIIHFYELKSGNYIMLDHNRVIIDKHSSLANDIKSLYINGDLKEISDLVYQLSLADKGFIDDSISKYI
jgi:hypothetical protein